VLSKQSSINAKPGSQQTNFFFQPKLSINQPNDVYEQEANHVADQVMNMNVSANTPTFFSPVSMQRKCAECEEEEKNMQRKENDHNPTPSSPQTENYISSVSGGNALRNEDRAFFESRMGCDFSNVRIHSDAGANQSAKNINALAYTHGNDIVFAQGQYQPGTNEGKKLLAHELTHVLQQSNGDVSLKCAPEMIQRAMDKDPSELDDDQLKSEYDAYNEYVHRIAPEDYSAEEENMSYFLALERELKKRCLKSNPSHPKDVSQKLIDRITGKYASIDGDPGEGLFLTPYVASEGQCTIGYGHVIFPKSTCTINTETTDDGKTKKTCTCASPWNAITKERAIEVLKQDIQKHIKEVDSKIKVDLKQAEFDAMVDLSAHVGSVPSDFTNYVNENWCTNKEAVRERYLKTAITMKDPDTKKYKVMKNFVERRKRRAW
jgi:GH24 family phage-related lysozyme (muramidase)